MANCPKYVTACATIAGEATDGPAEGTSKSELCVETLGCVLSSGCASCIAPNGSCNPITKLGTCYYRAAGDLTQTLFPVVCIAPSPEEAGPCRLALERSLESTSCPTLVASFGDSSKGGSWALLLTQCLIDNRCSTCFPAVDAGDDAADETANPP
jgi:hypothetical protein